MNSPIPTCWDLYSTISSQRAVLDTIAVKKMVIAAMIVWHVLSGRKKKEDPVAHYMTIYLPIVAAIYLIGLLVTYFTFHISEANENKLACFYRYTGTITILLVCILVYLYLERVMQSDTGIFKLSAYSLCILSVLCVLCMILGFKPGYIFGFQYYDATEEYTTAAWDFLQNNYSERWDYNTDKYLVIVDVEDKGYDNFHKLEHLFTTFFRSRYCWVYDIKDIEPGSIPLEFLLDDNYNIIIYDEEGKIDISDLIDRNLFEGFSE